MHASLPKHDIVLLGAGHTNAYVLRQWRMAPLAQARLTCVSDFLEATYSGMLPGTLAGLYPPGRMSIDLVRLCAAGGVRLIQAAVTGLDLDRRELLLADRPPLPFDVLSIGVGSVPRRGDLQRHPSVVPIKPMQTFLERLECRLENLRDVAKRRPLQAAVVGGGAGGVEITFCLPEPLRQASERSDFKLTLIDSGDRLVTGQPQRTADLVLKELKGRGVEVLLGQTVLDVNDAGLRLADGRVVPADVVIWSTGAEAPPLLAHLGLPTDEAGFLATRPTLQTVGDAPVFAVGDSGTIVSLPTPKAGVYAVRQGPILWENLGRMISDQPLVEYQPQRGFLSLLCTGDGGAILSYKGLATKARWCWRLKDRIDGRFMDMYQDYTPMRMGAPGAAGQAMRCAGCGGKVGGSVLSRVLARLEIPRSEHVLLGLETPDDAAIVAAPGGRPLVVTADFFAAFLDDPYLVGRVAALNAASDLFALGSRPLAALALATIPVGPDSKQEQLLYELLAGGLHEFRAMGATLIGGHTIEGSTTTIGYSMLADAGDGPPRTKARLREGDVLVLTKPIGTGILLAAHMQARLRAEWFAALVPVLLASNQSAAALCQEFDIQGLTDVTGFGLAGHLMEMLRASRMAARLQLDAVPLLPGVSPLVAEGVESTLAPANRVQEDAIRSSAAQRQKPSYATLFDPQTSGGLLMGVPRQHVEAVLRRLAELSDVPAAAIGVVERHDGEKPAIFIE